MLKPAVLSEQRTHARAPLHLRVQVRWPGALRQVVEVTDTLDVSRGGLLFYSRDPGQPGARIWVTLPFHPQSPATQPETPARVVRVRTTPTGGHLVAAEYEAPHQRPRTLAGNQRASERFPLALPLRVRPAQAPWPEETMTADISESGVRFRTARQYAVGEEVRVSVSHGPWATAGEVPARIARTQPIPGSVEQWVAVALGSPPKP